jgi:hypothetical protein
MHRSRRPIEPEAVFGQSKSNKGYNRFRHFNDKQTDRVMMDFAIFAVAFNLEKLHRKRQDAEEKQAEAKNNPLFTGFILFCQQENRRSAKIKTSPQQHMDYAA